MRKWYLLAVMASTVTLIAACEPALPSDGSGAPMSPNSLPTLPTPTAPPTAPTDNKPKGVLAGRVSGLTASCVELTLDDGAVWSLSGAVGDDVQVGFTVVANVVKLAEGEAACGPGLPARIVLVKVVG